MADNAWIPFDDSVWGNASWLFQWEYDPSPDLARLARHEDEKEAWKALWGFLHHQGDVCERSYLTVVALSQMPSRPSELAHLFGFVAVIEDERHQVRNPPVPPWLRPAYDRALESIALLALDVLRSEKDPYVARFALAAVAFARSQLEVGSIACQLTPDELRKLAAEKLAWGGRYDPDR